MVVDLSKTPAKFVLLCSLFSFIPVLFAVVFFTMFSSGTAHAVPHEFAVDNEQRIYLSFDSGLYVVENGRFTFLFPSERYGYALSVSEDDMLTIADASVIRIVDLAKSDPASGHLEVVKKTRERGNSLYDIWRKSWETDLQNDVTYRCENSFFYYEILREDARGASVFFAMPHSDYVWNIVAKTCFVLFFLYIVAGMLVLDRYFKKHPEFLKRTAYPWQKRTNQ